MSRRQIATLLGTGPAGAAVSDQARVPPRVSPRSSGDAPRKPEGPRHRLDRTRHRPIPSPPEQPARAAGPADARTSAGLWTVRAGMPRRFDRGAPVSRRIYALTPVGARVPFRRPVIVVQQVVC